MCVSVRSDVAVVAELEAAPLSFGTVVAHECIEVSACVPMLESLLDDTIMIAVRIGPKSNAASTLIDLSLP